MSEFLAIIESESALLESKGSEEQSIGWKAHRISRVTTAAKERLRRSLSEAAMDGIAFTTLANISLSIKKRIPDL